MTEHRKWAQHELNLFAQKVWATAVGDLPKASLPVRVIDDPLVIKGVFDAHETFPKNYAFLDALARGRFTDSSTSWGDRMAITQASYSRNDILKSVERLDPIYEQEFGRKPLSSASDISEAAVRAAIRVVSIAFGVSSPIPWPEGWAEDVRNALSERQWAGMGGVLPERLSWVNAELARLRNFIAGVWSTDPNVQALLRRFEQAGANIPDFDPVQELIQNLIASSETTAASLLWAVAVMSREPFLQQGLRDGTVDAGDFVRELLRMYPPVPFVSRYSSINQTVGGADFSAGEPILISVIGLHYSDFWEEPGRFVLDRSEYTSSAFKAHYLPFLTGPRACGGRRLAEAELKAAILNLLRLFEFRSADHSDIDTEYGLSFQPTFRSLQCLRLPVT